MDDHIDFVLDPDAICRRDVNLAKEALDTFNQAVQRLHKLGYWIEVDTVKNPRGLPDLVVKDVHKRIGIPGGVAAPGQRSPRARP